MVTLMEKAAEFLLRENMGDISPPFFPGDLWGLYRRETPAVQETDKTVHHIDP